MQQLLQYIYFTNLLLVNIIRKSKLYLNLTLALIIMSKKGCLFVIVLIVILIIILVACGATCVLLSSAVSTYDLESTDSVTSKTLYSGGTDMIAVINVEGIVMDADATGDIWGSAFASSTQITSYIDNAMNDENVKAIILSMDTPGGDVYASDIIYNKVMEAQQEGIVVVTLMRGVAASGGYYIAAPSDVIVASPLTFTGSIGVVMEVQSLDGLYEKLGIETRSITNTGGDLKTGEGLFDDDPEGEEDKIYQALVDEAYYRFINIIVEGRKMEREEVIKIADGRILSGTQAKEIGLVDSLGDLDTAVSLAEEEAGISNATVVSYESYDFWSMLSGYFTSIVNPTASVMKLVDTVPGPKLRYIYVE